MPWIRGPCRCGFGPHAWLWAPTPGETYPYPIAYPPSPATAYPIPPVTWNEREMLEEQAKFLEGQLEQIRRRLEELKK